MKKDSKNNLKSKTTSERWHSPVRNSYKGGNGKMPNKKRIASGLFTSKVAAENGADWWRARGFDVRVDKVKGGYKHYRRRK